MPKHGFLEFTAGFTLGLHRDYIGIHAKNYVRLYIRIYRRICFRIYIRIYIRMPEVEKQSAVASEGSGESLEKPGGLSFEVSDMLTIVSLFSFEVSNM